MVQATKKRWNQTKVLEDMVEANAVTPDGRGMTREEFDRRKGNIIEMWCDRKISTDAMFKMLNPVTLAFNNDIAEMRDFAWRN